MNSGGISGGLDPDSMEAGEHAKSYYNFLRSVKTDVAAIAANVQMDVALIQQIKDYLFIDEHYLAGVIKQFDPNYAIAQSWQRLWDGKNIQPHDLTLLLHEDYERALMVFGIQQDEAHVAASKRYNYTEETRDYYAKANKYREGRRKHTR